MAITPVVGHDHGTVFAAVPDHIHRATLAARLATAVHRPMPDGLEAALIEPWTGPVGQPASYCQVAQFDYEYTDWLDTRYPELDIPVGVPWGAQDLWIAPSAGERLCDLVPGANLRVLPDAGHSSMVDRPGLFARELGGPAPALRITRRGQRSRGTPGGGRIGMNSAPHGERPC